MILGDTIEEETADFHHDRWEAFGLVSRDGAPETVRKPLPWNRILCTESKGIFRVIIMNIDYIAGFFDGEGAISLGFHGKRHDRRRFTFAVVPRIELYQKDKAILDEIRQFINLGKVRRRKDTHFGKPQYYLDLASLRDCKKFVELFDGKLIVKKSQLEVLKQFFEIHKIGEWRSKECFLTELRLWEKMHEINGKKTRKTVEEVLKAFNERLEEESRKKELLKDLYWNKRLTQREIAAILGVNKTTVRNRMKKYGIQRRSCSEAQRLYWERVDGVKRQIPLSKDELKKLYWHEHFSLSKIASKLNVSKQTVHRWMKKYNIPRRSRYVR